MNIFLINSITNSHSNCILINYKTIIIKYSKLFKVKFTFGQIHLMWWSIRYSMFLPHLYGFSHLKKNE